MDILLYTSVTFVTGYLLGRLSNFPSEQPKIVIVHEKEPEIQLAPEVEHPPEVYPPAYQAAYQPPSLYSMEPLYPNVKNDL